MAQQQLRTEHAGVIGQWQAAFDGERSAKQQVEERCAAELAVAAGQVRAETLARQQAEGAAACAGVMESLINSVEETVKIKQFMEQLVRMRRTRRPMHARHCVPTPHTHTHASIP